MKRLKTVLLVVIMLCQTTFFLLDTPAANAENGYAKVYVICLNGVPCARFGVNDDQNIKYSVRDGALNATVFEEQDSIPWVHPKYGNVAPFYSITYQVVTDWNTYRDIVLHCNGSIIVNTHGEILPIPSGYGLDWINITADAVLNRSMTWVHTGSYPFFRVWNQGASNSVEWGGTNQGTFGFRNFTSNINLPGALCWPATSELDTSTGFSGGFEDALSGWTFDQAKYPERGRPLKCSDFDNYTVFPIWSTGVDLIGGVIAFSKVGQRKSYQGQTRSGAYVHIGTRCTYNSTGQQTEGDYFRGYIGTAAAIWVETSAFAPTITVADYNYGNPVCQYPSNWSFGVQPFLGASSYDLIGHTCKVEINFPIYGCMRTNSAQLSLSKIVFDLNSPSTFGCATGMKINENVSSVYFDTTNPVPNPHNLEPLGRATAWLEWGGGILAGLFGVGWIATGIGGLKLLADTFSASTSIDPNGRLGFGPGYVDTVHFQETPNRVITQKPDFTYTEFFSLVNLEVYIDLTGRQQWTVVPLRLDVSLLSNVNNIETVSIYSEYDIAIYQPLYDKTSFISTAFFDCFDKGLGSWQAGDINSSSGNDYWGTVSPNCYGSTFGSCVWCAAIGTDSTTGLPNTNTMNYDNNMNATLTYSINVRPYQNISLCYDMFYRIAAGDYLAVEYYSQSWNQILGVAHYTGGGAEGTDNLTQVCLPSGTTAIRFRFYSDSSGVNFGVLLKHVELREGFPNDGGSGTKDAGDACNEALPINSIFGYLSNRDDDYYNFTVAHSDIVAENEIYVSLYGPSNTNFQAMLYNPSGQLKGGSSQHFVYVLSSSDNSGNWSIKIFAAMGYGPYTFGVTIQTSGGGGCPYVYVWTDRGFVKDNNILPASETGNGTDVKDYYLLQQRVVPIRIGQQTSFYSLQIREFENEQDFIDQVKLIAVDHLSNANIATTPEGGIVTYTTPASPLICFDDNNVSRLSEIGRMDGNVFDPSTYFQGNEGNWLLLDFGRVASANANLILRDDWKCMDVCINVQVPNVNGSWQTVEVLHPRDSWAMEAVNMTAYLPANDNFIVRLLWTATHRLDYVGLDTSSPATIQVYSTIPTLAVHSTLGIVTQNLLYDDEKCVELVNGQRITLAFAIPNKGWGLIRDFIFYTDGYYYGIDP